MTRTATLVAITLLSAITAPVGVHATTPKTNAVAATATVAAPGAVEPSCARQVRVVYAGYGEGQGAPCTVLAR